MCCCKFNGDLHSLQQEWSLCMHVLPNVVLIRPLSVAKVLHLLFRLQ